MEFIVEFFVTLFFEVPFETTMESKRVKPWVKTTAFLILGGALSAIFTLIALSVWNNEHDLLGCIAMTVIALGWTIFVLCAAVSGHKRRWTRK